MGFAKISERITGGGVSNVQLREILAHLAVINSNLRERPAYRREANAATGECTIRVALPSVFAMDEPSKGEFGEIMEYVCRDYVRAMPESAEILSHIRAGNYTFLFKEDGSFNDECLRLAT